MQWTFEKLDQSNDSGELQYLAEFLEEKKIDLVINLPKRSVGTRSVSSFVTNGYRTRRLAVDLTIPLVTDVKCAKLLVEALYRISGVPPMKTHTDCMTSRRIKKLPGFIDVHVHLRDPGATHKEDFSSGTAAALAGGITMVLAMPNTNPSIIDKESFQLVKDIAKLKAHCDYGIYVGASSTNFDDIHELAADAAALKMYLNQTFSTLQLNDMTIWRKHLKNWPKAAPLVVHAECQSLAAVVFMAHALKRPIHVAHVARREEIEVIRMAKEMGTKVTCEVCPHHLFLSTDDVERMGAGRAEVRPMLCSPEDQAALWDNLEYIDVFATDHAPHTVDEKDSKTPPPGFPGLETILPLLLNAVNKGRLTLEDIINKFHRNPRKIFNLPEQPNTYVEVDLDAEWTIPEKPQHSKAHWTPFAGTRVKGAVHRVILRGEVAFVDGDVLVEPGYGKNIREWNITSKTDYKLIVEKSESMISDIFDTSIESDTVRNGDLLTDNQTNDVFTSLLSGSAHKPSVHFTNGDHVTIRQPSPLPRIRCDSTGTTTLKELVQHTTAQNTTIKHGLHGKHILSATMFSKEQLNDIFNLAHIFKNRVAKDRNTVDVLRGKIMASIFYEASTRTSCSFAAAMLRLGGQVINMNESTSSVQKGETLEDSIATMAGYSDVIVLRHPNRGAVLVIQIAMLCVLEGLLKKRPDYKFNLFSNICRQLHGIAESQSSTLAMVLVSIQRKHYWIYSRFNRKSVR